MNTKEILSVIASSISLFIIFLNALLVIIYSIKKKVKNKQSLKVALELLPDLINKAEYVFSNEYGKKTGQQKLEFVVNSFYSLIENSKKLISEEDLKDKIEKILSTPKKHI